MKTFLLNPREKKIEWHLVDADGAILGRLATRVATILRGKHRPTFSPHLDSGDGVIVVNAEKVRLTGRKAQQEVHYRHSGYPGGLRAVKVGDLLRTKPEQLITDAVRGMLPKNRLGDKLLGRLRVYRGPEHKQQAQKPEKVELAK